MVSIQIDCREGCFNLLDHRAREWRLTISSHLGDASIYLKDNPHLGEMFGVEDAVCAMREGYARIISGSKSKDLKLLDAIMDDLDAFELVRHRDLLIKAQKIHREAFKKVEAIASIIEGLSE